jgi:DNA-directed RNA polymerase specialized sigma24 family protein
VPKSARHNRGRHLCQRPIRDDPRYRCRRHSRRLDTWLHANRPLRDATEFDEDVFTPDSRAPNPEEAVLQNDNNTLVRRALEKLPATFLRVLRKPASLFNSNLSP